jgi:hypothetical protein
MPKIGGNRWNDYVREFAKKNNTTYGCAISMPECKEGYKALYPKPVKGKRGRPKKTKPLDEDFGLAPENISMSIAEIEPENKKEMESMGAEDKNVSKERLDDLLDMWDKILDNNDKTPIKTQGAYVKRLQKPILVPLAKAYEDKRFSATQKKRYKALWKRSNSMFENLPKAKDLKKKKEEAKATPFEPLEEAKPSTEPKSKGITIKKKETVVVPNVAVSGVAPASTRIKASEVSALAKDFQTIYSNNKTNPPMLKALAKPIITKLAGWYNANLLSKNDDKFVASLVASYNKAVKIKSGEVELEGKGRRINRVRLKRMRGGKENHSYEPELHVSGQEPVNPTLIDVMPPPPVFVAVPPPLPVGNQRLRRRMVNGEAVVERGRGRPRKGGNVFTDLTNKVQQFRQGAKDVATQAVSAITPQPVKDVVKDVGNRFFGDELPNNVKATLKKYGDQQITGLTLGRTPVPKYITEALNVVSFGEWKKKFADKPYDTLYHLFLYIKTSGGSFGIEKNERINTFASIPPNSQTAEVNGNFGGLTPNILLEKTQQLLGESAFKNYDPYNNNCQHFITAILKANHLGSPADLAFVKQDTESLFENSPQTATFAKTLTDLGARVSKITGRGRGRPRKIGGVPLQTAQILNPTFLEHPEAYFNPLLKHQGVMGTVSIPRGIGMNAGGYETDSSTSSSSSSSSSDMEGRGNPHSKIATTDRAPTRGEIEAINTEKANKWIKRTTFTLQGKIKYANAEINRLLNDPNADRTDDNEYQTLLVTKHRAQRFLDMPYREKRQYALQEIEKKDAKRRGEVVSQEASDLDAEETSDAEPLEAGNRNPELKHELRNYQDILGHLSSHLLSNEKQDPKDARDALRYARELVRVLKKFRG